MEQPFTVFPGKGYNAPMNNQRLLLPFLALVLVLGVSTFGYATETIPPLFRAERHFSAGEQYLRGLPDNTRITIARTDGTTLVLDLKAGKLVTTLPPSRLSADNRTLTTPLGYRLTPGGDAQGLGLVEAPSGSVTSFTMVPKYLVAKEPGPRLWSFPLDKAILRLTDGTRVDLLEGGSRWEVITLLGERFSKDPQSPTWSVLPSLPSPPLIPAIPHVYPATGGGVWRIPVDDDHLVFAWNWFPVGIELERVLDEVRGGVRRKELNSYFNELAQPQPPAEMAGCLLASRFVLGVGDQITFSAPGKEPETVFLVPGFIEAPYVLPNFNKRISKLPSLMSEPPDPRKKRNQRLPQ